jgi:hypothetical protein
MVVTGETEVLGEETCQSATLFDTDLTWTGLDSNPSFRGETPATDRLCH